MIKITQLPIGIRVKMIVALGLVTILTLGITFYWMAKYQEDQIIQQTHTQAKALFDHMILTRAWIASYGGVFVSKRDDAEDAPYLAKIPGSNIEIESISGQIYTFHNPETVTRELSEFGTEHGENINFHVASLKPVNPNSAPTKWEAEALRSFEQGRQEASTIAFENGVETYQYMAPMVVTEDCLPCHKAQGYKVGDIRGGISVSMPFTKARTAINNTFWQFFLTGVGTTITGIIIIYVSVNLLMLSPLRKIEETAREISQGRLEQRVPVRTQDELGSLAQSFNHMTDQLQRALEISEQLVAERTKRLEAVATLSGHLNAILDFDQLLVELVNQVKERFGYYHAHIYLLDHQREKLVVAEGTGKAGAEMKTRGHNIALNASTSLVARAARTGQIVKIDNVQEAEDWLPNPLLPNTYSEIAVPIILDGRVTGVLDVQQDKVAGLDEGDADLLRSLANHVAVSLTNAHLFEQTQVALAETEKLYSISQQMMSAKTLSDLVAAVAEGLAIPAISRAILLVCEYNAAGNVETLKLSASWYSGYGTPPRPLGTRYSWATPTVVNMALTSEPLFFDDVQEDERADPITIEGAEQRNVRAMIVLPLFSQGRQMGGLILLGEEKYHFTRQEVRPYFSLVGQLAVAVENQYLFEQTKQRALELEEARNFLDSIVENIPSILFVKDAQDLRFVQWNKTAQELTGRTPEEIIGQTGYDFLPDEQAEQWLARDREVLSGSKLMDIAEESVRTVNQEVRLLQMRRVPIMGAGGEIKYLLGISEDITKRKQAEATLKQANEDLIKLNADKDKFFSIVAHDLRGPFSPVVGISRLLMETAHEATDDEIKTLCASIHRSAQNVYSLLENLLQWSRVQSGHMPYEPTTLNLKDIMEHCVSLLLVNAAEKEITLQNKLTKDLFVYADKNMLNTIMRNLTINALKFTPQGGQVTLLATLDNSSFVQVSVSDTGVGMSQTNIEKLFKIEVSHSTLGTAREKGTGLGLIICQEMVEQNGGKIWVESELGAGTTVKFTTPLDSSSLTMSLLEMERIYNKDEGQPKVTEDFDSPRI